ncbi:Hypothetical protein LUCI_3244 [Lucifera butyrica]|uniref:Lipoprotein n=1 Tax=Lucifera butyrica TaxID=1351585 RepID=A0A498R9Z8_9FIRM|nr:hypothetical protein [Lucifera butyrica]VBB07979.1 Hypothetical protein LUCI_3244 [Lucifera butyrica]
MKQKKHWVICLLLFLLLVFIAGCSLHAPVKKPDIGPAGKPPESKPNPPFAERFWSPPGQLYDLETTAGVVFEGIQKADWSQVQSGLTNLQTIWREAKPVIGEKKGVKQADEALEKLVHSVDGQQTTATYKNLNSFMSSISEIGKSYKLSPLSDIITIDNVIRDVSFYTESNNWSKSASKVKSLEDTWGSLKTNMEKVGILGEITKSHSFIQQLKDAVNAENEGGVKEQITNLNESMGKIRNFYHGK